MSLKVAVIGGGNGGFATASQMALAGHEVHLFELPDFSANIAELKETPVIEVSGALLTGEARLAGVSCDPADGFSDCEIVLVTTQTLGHIPTARLIAHYVRLDQGIFLMPGTCGSVPFRQELDKAGAGGIVAECLSLPYACRKKGPRSVGISRSTGTMGLAAFPSERTGEALELFRKVYPGSFGMDNVLEVALCNAGRQHAVINRPPERFEVAPGPIAAAIRRGLADGTVDPTADVKTLYYNTYDSILGVIQRMSIGVPSVHELDGHARIDALCEQFTRAFAAPPKQ